MNRHGGEVPKPSLTLRSRSRIKDVCIVKDNDNVSDTELKCIFSLLGVWDVE